MKTKLFHVGKSTISVVLAVMMLLSTMLLGSLSTVTAATVEDSGSVAASATDDGSVAAPANDEVGSSTAKIYFANTSSWTSPYIWSWTDGTNYTGGTWPGKAMTEDSNLTSSKGIGIYYYELSTSAANIIFSNNSNDNASQTADLTLPSGWDSTSYVYDLKNTEWVTLDSYTYSSSTTTDYSGWTLKGSFDNWGSGVSFSSDGVATLTLTANSTTYFKLVKGDTYYGNNGEITKSITGWNFETGNDNGNCTLVPGLEGVYTFTLTSETPTLSVTYPTEESSASTIFYSTSTSASDYKSNAVAVTPNKNENSDGSVTYSYTFNTIGDSGLPVGKDILFTYADSSSTGSVWAESTNGFNGGVEGYISTGNYGINNYYTNDDGSTTSVSACKVYIQNTDVTSVTVSVTKNSAGKAIGWYVTGEYNATARLVAKNGTIRNSGGNYDSITQNFGTTTVSYDTSYISSSDITITDSTSRKVVKMTEAAISKGLDLTISTTMTETAFENYYIAGYVINGETYALQEDAIADYSKATQTVSFTYRVPLTTEADDVIEVTPVYFMKSPNTIRFYVEDYENVKDTWGDTLACYAYYSTGEDESASFNKSNGFGCYPGQPMLKTGGRYFYDLPSSITVSGTAYSIKGITLNNYRYDDVHSSLVDDTNYQTYDYSDFSAIYNQKIANSTSTTKPDIIFAFKYTAEATGADHFGDGVTIADGSSTTTPTSASKSDTALGNVTENLTDFYGDRVDLFHTNIENSTTVNNNPWIAISNGYESCEAKVNGEVGYYATRWAIYKPSDSGSGYTFVTAINSASLFYSSADDLTTAGYTTEATAYTALVNAGAANQPVVISYEKEDTRAYSLANTSEEKNGQSAARSDGVWYYSEPDTTVTAHTVVQYAQTYKANGYSDSDYMTDYYQASEEWNYSNPVFDFDVDGYDPETTSKYYGQTTGLQAYFSYSADSVDYWHKTEGKQKADGSKGFYMYAENTKASDYAGDNSTSYRFDGWYKWNSSSNTYTFITSNAGYWTVATGSDVYVARFSPVPTDTVTIQHLLYPSSTGTGTLGLTVKVQDANGNTVWQETETGSAITVPATYISTDSTYKIVITLNTTPDSSSEFTNFYGTDDTGEAKNASEITSSSTTVTAKDSSANTASGGMSGYDTSSTPKTVTVTYNVSDLYPSGGTEPMSVLDLYSRIDVDLKVLINYKFETRYYGEKVYQVISDNYYTNVNSNAETVTLNSGNWTVGNYIEKNGTDSYKLSENCLTAYAPDETNFNQSFSWDIDNATQTYDSSTATITATVVARQAKDLTRTATITVYNANGNLSSVVATGEYPENVNVLGEADLTANYHFTDNDGGAVSTARTYTDSDGVTHTFSYWDVKTTDGKNVTKVYPSADDTSTTVYFGYSAFDNYTVTAEYDSTDETKNTITATVQELADTRNHWNNTTTGNADTDPTDSTGDIVYGNYSDATKDYDRLYIDFALAFKVVDSDNKVVQLNIDENASRYKVGLVVVNADSGLSDENIKTAITSKLNDNSSTTGVVVKSIDASKLTNKNRVEYCLGYSNTDAVRNSNLTVYSYIVDTDGTVHLSTALTGVDYSNCTAITTD